MSKRFLFWALVALFVGSAHAQEPRLAVVAADLAHQTAADLLTSELSRQTNLTLLERAQISKVLGELATSALSGKDFLKLGQLVGADGLLLLVAERQGTNDVLTARLLAVKPGVILQEHSYPWPLKNSVEWSSHVAKQFEPLFPKLTVLPKDAIPISVVGLRSALHSAESQESEKQLTQLLIARLTKEPEIFVLERQHLREANSEKELKPPAEESPFWTGSCLLEGTLDKDGFDPEKLTVNARLTPPQNGPPSPIELSGPRKDPPALVEALTGKILAALHRTPSAKNWQPLSEADKYYAESQWALRWGLAREAQQAGESAWALGKHTRDCLDLLINAYTHDPAFDRLQGAHSINLRTPYENYDWDIEYEIALRQPDPSTLRPLQRVLELYCENSPTILTNPAKPDKKWLVSGLDLVNNTGGALEAYYHAAEARLGREAELTEVRALVRRVVRILEENDPSASIQLEWGYNINLDGLKWTDGGYWYEKPEEALQMQVHVLERDWLPDYPPWAVGWSWTDRKRVPRLIKTFAEDVANSTNAAVRMKGVYLLLVRAPVSETADFQQIEEKAFSAMWNERHTLAKNLSPRGTYQIPAPPGGTWSGPGLSLFQAVETTLRRKYDALYTAKPLPDARFAEFQTRLRRDFLANPSNYTAESFQQFFPPYTNLYTPAEALEFFPPIAAFVQKPSFGKQQRFYYNDIINQVLVSPNRQQESPTQTQSATAPQPSPSQQDSALLSSNYDIIKFTPLKLGELPPYISPVIQSAIYRHHKIWFQIRYITKPGYGYVSERNKVTFVAVNPETGETELIPFPSEFGLPDPRSLPELTDNGLTWFEVTDDSLYVSLVDKLERYRFHEKRWEAVPIPMEQGASLVEFGDHLFLSTGDSIQELEPDTGKIKILASARRRPALIPLDERGPYAAIYPASGKGINVVAGNAGSAYRPGAGPTTRTYGALRSEVYLYTPKTGAWEKTDLWPVDANPYRFKFKGKGPSVLAWAHIRFEKDGKLTDTNFRPPEYQFSSIPLEIMFRCDAPYGKVIINPVYAGFWLVPAKLLEGGSQ